MNENNDLTELRGVIVRDLHLEKEEEMLTSENFEILRQKLIEVINLLLHTDYHRLLNAMYRLDINEKLFREAFSGMHSPNVAARLADLVIEREKEKIATRKKYRS
jgi:hypothetical protein